MHNPESSWGDGFTFNHLATPWLNYPELLERRQSYSVDQFHNECLGLPSSLGDHIVTRRRKPAVNRGPWPGLWTTSDTWEILLVAGIDWGGGAISRTVLVIGYYERMARLVVLVMEKFPAHAGPG